LKPLTSTSRTIEGGLTFFPQPGTPGPADSSGCGTVAFALRDGGAYMTAAAEIEEEDDPEVNAAGAVVVKVVNAPAGSRGALGLGLLTGALRVGAKAREADQPYQRQ
jgi:hypothetical protein